MWESLVAVWGLEVVSSGAGGVLGCRNYGAQVEILLVRNYKAQDEHWKWWVQADGRGAGWAISKSYDEVLLSRNYREQDEVLLIT